MLYFRVRSGLVIRVDSAKTGWKEPSDGSDADEWVAPLGSWHKEAWAERQQREHVKQAMRALEESGVVFILERIPAAAKELLRKCSGAAS